MQSTCVNRNLEVQQGDRRPLASNALTMRRQTPRMRIALRPSPAISKLLASPHEACTAEPAALLHGEMYSEALPVEVAPRRVVKD